MLMNTPAFLKPKDDGRVALDSVDIQATLRGLLSEVSVTQIYKNLEDRNIEAVYTFPLPFDAVLLELWIELNGKKMKGVVKSRIAAGEDYEEAIEEGDTAILLEQSKSGLFTMNVGNILCGESIKVHFKFTQLHHWQADSLRFSLPTTVAPRYGDPLAAGLEPHQIPEVAFSVNYGMSVQLKIVGELAKADIEFPSHPIKDSTKGDVRVVEVLGKNVKMDRDFIVVIKKPAFPFSQGLWAVDNNKHVVLASFQPQFPDDYPRKQRCVKIVVDCSGSMHGSSIAHAKEALQNILSMLKSDDYFNLIKFGSYFDALFKNPVQATKNNRQIVNNYIDEIDADMGGTEIQRALEECFACGTVNGLSNDVLLITDGQFYETESAITSAKRSKHRIFTVGIGYSSVEPALQRISEETFGACELVSPKENIAERITRHFARIDQGAANSVSIEWSAPLIRQTPEEIETVYANDTVHVFGRFGDSLPERAALQITFDDGRRITQEVAFVDKKQGEGSATESLPRVAAHARLPSLKKEKAAKLAEKYQLVTEFTSCILVVEREDDEKSPEIPRLRIVPHRHPHDWSPPLMFGSRMQTVEHSKVLYNKTVASADAALHPGIYASVEQQDLTMLFSERAKAVKTQTKWRNSIRALLAERGLVAGRSIRRLDELIHEVLSADDETLFRWQISKEFVSQLGYEADQLRQIESKVKYYTDRIERNGDTMEAVKRLQRIPGFGPIVASALIVAVGDGREFGCGRDMAAWFDLVPRQHSRGGREQFGGISEAADRYARKMLIHGASAVCRSANLNPKNTDPVHQTARQAAKEGNSQETVMLAVANQMARIAWAILSREVEYDARYQSGGQG